MYRKTQFSHFLQFMYVGTYFEKSYRLKMGKHLPSNSNSSEEKKRLNKDFVADVWRIRSKNSEDNIYLDLLECDPRILEKLRNYCLCYAHNRIDIRGDLERAFIKLLKFYRLYDGRRVDKFIYKSYNKTYLTDGAVLFILCTLMDKDFLFRLLTKLDNKFYKLIIKTCINRSYNSSRNFLVNFELYETRLLSEKLNLQGFIREEYENAARISNHVKYYYRVLLRELIQNELRQGNLLIYGNKSLIEIEIESDEFIFMSPVLKHDFRLKDFTINNDKITYKSNVMIKDGINPKKISKAVYSFTVELDTSQELVKDIVQIKDEKLQCDDQVYQVKTNVKEFLVGYQRVVAKNLFTSTRYFYINDNQLEMEQLSLNFKTALMLKIKHDSRLPVTDMFKHANYLTADKAYNNNLASLDDLQKSVYVDYFERKRTLTNKLNQYRELASTDMDEVKGYHKLHRTLLKDYLKFCTSSNLKKISKDTKIFNQLVDYIEKNQYKNFHNIIRKYSLAENFEVNLTQDLIKKNLELLKEAEQNFEVTYKHRNRYLKDEVIEALNKSGKFDFELTKTNIFEQDSFAINEAYNGLEFSNDPMPKIYYDMNLKEQSIDYKTIFNELQIPWNEEWKNNKTIRNNRHIILAALLNYYKTNNEFDVTTEIAIDVGNHYFRETLENVNKTMIYNYRYSKNYDEYHLSNIYCDLSEDAFASIFSYVDGNSQVLGLRELNTEISKYYEIADKLLTSLGTYEAGILKEHPDYNANKKYIKFEDVVKLDNLTDEDSEKLITIRKKVSRFDYISKTELNDVKRILNIEY